MSKSISRLPFLRIYEGQLISLGREDKLLFLLIIGLCDRQDFPAIWRAEFFSYLTDRNFWLFDRQDFLAIWQAGFFGYLTGRIFRLFDQQDFLAILPAQIIWLFNWQDFSYFMGRIFQLFDRQDLWLFDRQSWGTSIHHGCQGLTDHMGL